MFHIYNKYIGILSQYFDKPIPIYLKTAKRVVKYLNYTRKLRIKDFIDGNCAEERSRKSITGYIFNIGEVTVSQNKKLQNIITLSTTEAEYIALTHAAKEAIWFRNLLSELFGPIVEPILINSDNQSAIALAKDDQFHACTKHINIRYHFI